MSAAVQMSSTFSTRSIVFGQPLRRVPHVQLPPCSRSSHRACRTCIAAAYRSRDDGVDIAAAARQRVGSGGGAVSEKQEGALTEFVRKLKAAWQIFFPPQPKSISPKEEGKNRLRMILVADRCGMNPSSLFEMKHSIVKAVSEYVDVEAEELVEVNVSTDADLGTIYSVAVPIKRVKPVARVPMADDVEVDGITLRWDYDDKEADPTSQFPYGC